MKKLSILVALITLLSGCGNGAGSTEALSDPITLSLVQQSVVVGTSTSNGFTETTQYNGCSWWDRWRYKANSECGGGSCGDQMLIDPTIYYCKALSRRLEITHIPFVTASSLVGFYLRQTSDAADDSASQQYHQQIENMANGR